MQLNKRSLEICENHYAGSHNTERELERYGEIVRFVLFSKWFKK